MTAGAAGSGAAAVEARLTWQVPDPAALSDDLRQRLGLQAMAHRGPNGEVLVPLGVAVLELIPWRREAPGDEPQPGGRLVLEPMSSVWAPTSLPAATRPPESASWSVPGSESASVSSSAPSTADAVMTLAAIGWGTVDLERAAGELAPWLLDDPVPHPGSPIPGLVGQDPHLGARTLLHGVTGLPGEAIVLAEPTTEGRLAASLARHGEGPVALYLRPGAGVDAWVDAARRRRVAVSARREGPLGPQMLVLPTRATSGVIDASGAGAVSANAAMAGPHLIVVGGGIDASGRSPDG